MLRLLMLLFPMLAMAQEPPVVPIGSYTVEVGERVTINNPLTLSAPDAVFVKVYFEPIGRAEITVSNADGSESHTYTPTKMGKHTKHGDNWAALSVDGNTAVVTVERGSVMVTRVDYGLREPVIPETTCGADNKVWVACHDAEVRDRARPVARVYFPGGGLCTAWRVGPGNMMMTNAHCTDEGAEIAGAEVWFDYEYDDCAGTIPKSPMKLVGGELLKTSQPLDYTLFTVDATAEELQPFGYFGLEPRPGVKGERIYIIGHPNALRKKGMVQSDLNDSGFCEVDVENKNGFAAHSDMGYWCDSEGGQSGSPVLTPTNDRAIALHHFGGCLNAGVKISYIWPEIAEFFGGVPPVGDNESPVVGPIAAMSFACVDNVCDYSAEGSTGNTYRWDFADGTFSDQFEGEKTYTTPDTYTVRLTVSDDVGSNTVSETVLVGVPGYNFPPQPRFSYTMEGQLVVYFESLSFDPDGQITDHYWRIAEDADWSYYSDATFRHTFNTAGEKYVDLRVRDDDGELSKSVIYARFTLAEPAPTPDPCGDGVCAADETHETCPADCPPDPCGDGVCAADETHESCPADCEAPPPDPITLDYSIQRVHGPHYHITLRWYGAEGETVTIYRDGAVSETANDGSQIFQAHKRDHGSNFRVCDSAQCSDTIRTQF